MGILGGFAFISIIFVGLRNFYRARLLAWENNQMDEFHLITAYGIAFLSFCLFMLFLSATYHKYLWIMLAISFVVYFRQRNNYQAIDHD